MPWYAPAGIDTGCNRGRRPIAMDPSLRYAPTGIARRTLHRRGDRRPRALKWNCKAGATSGRPPAKPTAGAEPYRLVRAIQPLVRPIRGGLLMSDRPPFRAARTVPAAALLLPLALVLSVGPALAAPRPTQYVLPGSAVYPEGIACEELSGD